MAPAHFSRNRSGAFDRGCETLLTALAGIGRNLHLDAPALRTAKERGECAAPPEFRVQFPILLPPADTADCVRPP
jgi:hypothetical protein